MNYAEVALRLGEVLKRLRKRHGVSQQYVGDALGVTAVAVGKWERGLAMPDLPKLIALADLFCVTLDELCGRRSAGPVQVRAAGAVQPSREARMRADGMQRRLERLQETAADMRSRPVQPSPVKPLLEEFTLRPGTEEVEDFGPMDPMPAVTGRDGLPGDPAQRLAHRMAQLRAMGVDPMGMAQQSAPQERPAPVEMPAHQELPAPVEMPVHQELPVHRENPMQQENPMSQENPVLQWPGEELLGEPWAEPAPIRPRAEQADAAGVQEDSPVLFTLLHEDELPWESSGESAPSPTGWSRRPDGLPQRQRPIRRESLGGSFDLAARTDSRISAGERGKMLEELRALLRRPDDEEE